MSTIVRQYRIRAAAAARAATAATTVIGAVAPRQGGAPWTP
jgi:hypothetical protein